MLQTSANTITDSWKNYAEESKYTHIEAVADPGGAVWSNFHPQTPAALPCFTAKFLVVGLF